MTELLSRAAALVKSSPSWRETLDMRQPAQEFDDDFLYWLWSDSAGFGPKSYSLEQSLECARANESKEAALIMTEFLSLEDEAAIVFNYRLRDFLTKEKFAEQRMQRIESETHHEHSHPSLP